MTEKRDAEDRENVSMPDEKQRKLAKEGGKIAPSPRPHDISNSGGTGDNRGGQVEDDHPPTDAHKLKAIRRDEITGHERGSNEDNLSIHTRVGHEDD